MMNKSIKYAIPLVALGLLTYQYFYRTPQICQIPHQATNGDELRYADKRGSFGKGLSHTSEGLVNVQAFDQLVYAIQTRSIEEYNRMQWGVVPPERTYTSLLEAFPDQLMGKAIWMQFMPPAPALASAEKASEMVELYWHALLRDVPFVEFKTDLKAEQAAHDLSRCTDFKGPKVDGVVTPETLFRAPFDGALEGPIVSQFFYLDVPLPKGKMLPQRYTTQKNGLTNEFMATIDEWLFIQLGYNPLRKIEFDPTPHYIRTPRDLGNYVHQDPPQWHFMCTQLILLNFGQEALKLGAPSLTNSLQPAQDEFCKIHIGALVSLATEMCSRGARYQKWFVHRTLRPEECGYLVHQQIAHDFDASLDIELIKSDAVQEIRKYNALVSNGNGTYLLPQMYPEGCPMHPTYPSGHAAVAGGCITILKAFFNEEFEIPNPVVPNASGSSLVAYKGEPLTLGHELTKFATNIALARNFAGVHYRSDAINSMLMGEQVALALLKDWAKTTGMKFSLSLFDGTQVTIG